MILDHYLNKTDSSRVRKLSISIRKLNLLTKLYKKMVTQGKIIERVSDTNWYVYVLRLENEKYYVGISVNPQRRFREHKKGGRKGAKWCKEHEPIEIYETVDTGTKRMKKATYFEDIKALECILKFGHENVSGGRYAGKQRKKAYKHNKRGYITFLHFLCTECDISIEKLEELNIYRRLMFFGKPEEVKSFIKEIRTLKMSKQDILRRSEKIAQNVKFPDWFEDEN